MGANDLYRYCLDMEVVEIEEADDADADGVALRDAPDGTKRKYHQILFKAHYEELCQGKATHQLSADPWPQGCLLSPRRVSWRETLVVPEEPSRHLRPGLPARGCEPRRGPGGPRVDPRPRQWSRLLGQGTRPPGVPPNLASPSYSIVSVDPSPTRYWGITWWLYNEPSDQWFLIDLEKRSLDAPDFLDWNSNEGRFTGLMDEWQRASRDIGIPITHWISRTQRRSAVPLRLQPRQALAVHEQRADHPPRHLPQQDQRGVRGADDRAQLQVRARAPARQRNESASTP